MVTRSSRARSLPCTFSHSPPLEEPIKSRRTEMGLLFHARTFNMLHKTVKIDVSTEVPVSRHMIFFARSLEILQSPSKADSTQNRK